MAQQTNRQTAAIMGKSTLQPRVGFFVTRARRERSMRRLVAISTLLLMAGGPPVYSACCYFSAKDKDVLQPAQKAFITWDPAENVETFTVQPKFEGNAADFAMV